MEPDKREVRCLSAGGFHRMAYWQWGDDDAARTVVCVHGLARNGRDFDALGSVLHDRGFRVICPDVAGRGASGWLRDVGSYGYPQYLADMTVLLARLGGERVDWVGTSMGGLIGMMLAAQGDGALGRLVLNDVGPSIPKAALERIAGYVGLEPLFSDRREAERYFREIYAPFGSLTDGEWASLTAHSLREADGGLRVHYDPKIGEALRAQPLDDVDLWALWDLVTNDTLVLRGAESDLLLPEVAQAMTQRGPKARLEVIEGCGHAPALLHADQIGLVVEFLTA